MQLNESTYETFFLLYVDNELSPRERLEVEAFIADNPSYALEMEELKATVLSAENVPYAFKENLKQQLDQTSLEALGEDWDANYATILKKEVQAIPGLSTSFKKSLKKTTVSEGILIKSFGFNQHKFTYAAIAACLMVFIGYQQLTKSQLSDSQISSSSATNSMVSNSLATNSNKVLIPNVSSASTASAKSEVTVISKSNKQELVNNIKPITKTKKEILNLKNLNTSELEIAKTNRNVSIAIVEPTSNNSILNNQAIITKLPSSYNNPITIDAMVENTTDEKATTSYELIDTEDPNRTISIANFEIDGAAFRGITRRISALLKRNKLEKEK
ncbi:MAG: anti-sigma factor family protein [Chitinophagia bacterium]